MVKKVRPPKYALKQKNKQSPFITFLQSDKFQTYAITSLLIATLIISYFIRHNSFYLSHANGDQNYYLSAAMKLEKFGFDEYNLSGVDQRAIRIKESQLAILEIFPAIKGQGTLYNSFDKNKLPGYKQPLHFIPPLFSYMLSLSHKILSNNDNFLVVISHLGKNIKQIKPSAFFKAQFYCVIIPIIFSLLSTLLIYFLALSLFHNRGTALLSAILFAFNPVEILCSFKLWAEEPLTFLTILTFYLYHRGYIKNSSLLFLLSGLICGAATLTKLSGGFVVFAILGHQIWIHRHHQPWHHRIIKPFLNKNVLFFFMGLAIVTAPWFLAVYEQYGTPLFTPEINPAGDQPGDWFDIIHNRPASFLLYLIGIPWIYPLFLFAYFEIIRSLFLKDHPYKKEIFLLLFWVLSYYFMFGIYYSGKEHRYLHPCYPALSILSGYFLYKTSIFINKRAPLLGTLSVSIIVLLCIIFSVSIGLRHVYENQALFLIPF